MFPIYEQHHMGRYLPPLVEQDFTRLCSVVKNIPVLARSSLHVDEYIFQSLCLTTGSRAVRLT